MSNSVNDYKTTSQRTLETLTRGGGGEKHSLTRMETSIALAHTAISETVGGYQTRFHLRGIAKGLELNIQPYVSRVTFIVTVEVFQQLYFKSFYLKM